MKRAALLFALICSACSLAPTYHRPSVDIPQQFGDGLFRQARPADDLPRGAWWKVYSDRHLDSLEEELSSNQDLKAALARLSEAQSALGAQRALLFPSIDLGASSQKLDNSKNRATYFRGIPTRYSDNQLIADVSYEPDVFGRISNQVKASSMAFEASKADVASLKLALEAELALNYFALQALRHEEALQKQIVSEEAEHLELIRALYDGGAAPEADFDQAEISLQNAKSQAHEFGLQDETLAHAIALLLGKSASGFKVETGNGLPKPQAFTSLPSTLLERRPDIASAERQVEAANAEIGVAKAAFFPNFTLNAMGGFESGQTGNLIDAPSELWSLGVGAAVNLFDAGLRRSLTDEARARYEETVAQYRQTVLAAYREVEDGMSSIRRLELEGKSQKSAVDSASKALDQAKYGFDGGMIPYQDVVASKIQYLQASQQLAQLIGRRMTASVLLVKALGGGPG
jgi:NodT family efflux transporter outer membrane factor (OMF) lipoprotein